MASIKLGKIDVACRQINTAITLWFTGGDPVSVHTLACSAYQIIHDINQQIGSRDLLYDSLVFKDEYRKEVVDQLKRSYNFFKHAEKDSTKTIEFNPASTDVFIMFTSLGLELLGVKPDEIRGAYTIYQMITNPKALTERGISQLEKIPEENRRHLTTMPKQDFFLAYKLLRPRYMTGDEDSLR